MAKMKNMMPSIHSATTSPLHRALAAGIALAVAGCSVVPEKITREQVASRVQSDQSQMYKDQEAISGPVTFSAALARALKYNLDFRLKLMESALAHGLFDVSKIDLLPKLVVEAGYTSRNNDSGGTSIGIEDRQVSLRPSTSEERTTRMRRAEFSWNALDFGISYYRAKQTADEYLITEERSRKILQNIVQDVRNAYWRAAGAQALAGEAETLVVRIRAALERSRAAERAGVLPPAQGLAYQRALLDAMAMVNIKRQEMEFAKRELAALMNVTPGTDFTLADMPDPQLSAVPVNVNELEAMALERRPELREEDYRARIGQNEARKQIAALFPSLNLFADVRYNSNTYLYNSSWSDSGATMSINLMRLTGLPAFKRTNEARAKSDETRRMALAMAVITQVRVSLERYRLSVLDHELAAESARVDQRLAAISRAGASNKLESELEALRTESRALVSRFQQAGAYASAHAAYARIMNSVGVDLLPAEVRATDVQTLTKAIETSLREGERVVFADTVADLPKPRAMSLQIGTLPAGANPGALRAAVEKSLTRNSIPLAAAGAKDAPVLNLALAAAPAAGGRATWSMVLSGADGVRLLSSEYVSFLPAITDERTFSSFAEAAVLSVVPRLHEALLPAPAASAGRP